MPKQPGAASRGRALTLILSAALLGGAIIANPTLTHGAPASTAATIQRADARLASVPLTPGYWVYVVRPGDTLVSIARRFHDSAWLISRRNRGNWQPAPGARLSVWRWPFYRRYRSTVEIVTDAPQVYRVRPGDSLFAISKQLHVTLSTLCGNNHLRASSTILPGQILVLHHYTNHLARTMVTGDGGVRLPPALLLTDIARFVGLDPALFKALVWKESAWRMVRGKAGEIGMVQILPSTAAWVERTLVGYPLDPSVPVDNALLGALLLQHYLDAAGHNTRDALALYHSSNTLPSARNRTYIAAILRLRDYFRQHPG
jgi:LysM repeat protein